MDDLLQEFIAETRETLEALAGEIIAWEASPDDRARLDAIFRFVHTVKGSCGFLDLPRLERLSHAAEDVLALVRSGERTPDRALVNAVLGIVDRIGEIVEAIDAGTALDDTGEDLLIAALAGGSADAPLQQQPAHVQRAPARSVRLSVDLLDRMMSGMSDMVLARNELARRLRGGDVDPAIEAALERMSATVADMRDTVTRTRMQKIDALFSALPRVVRDTAAGLGKQVALRIEGAEVELDREMIEVMRDPLVHIIRNAIDHGIEAPAERRLLGKPECGRLTVSASQAGNQIVLEIIDDGRGIDIERVIAKLVAAGEDERRLRGLPEAEKLALIFEPGLSTKDSVSSVSGRGVGMDVVRACVDQIGGRIDLDNLPGRGLRIGIHVPLTLSIISTIVVSVGEQCFAAPRMVIEEILSARSQAIRIDRVGGTQVATIRDRRMPIVDLGVMLGLRTPEAAREPEMLAVIGLGAVTYALAVDAVLDTEELVIKPSAPAVMRAGVYAGQTLPDSGRPMLLLDCAGLATAAGLRFHRETSEPHDAHAEAEREGLPVLMFRDLDGVRRAVPLAILDRIEQATPEAVQMTAGRLRLAIDGQLLPLASAGSIPEDRGFAVLRLRDGASEIGYAIAEAADIVTIGDAIEPAAQPGSVAGVVLVGDEPVELIDAFWLFAEHGAAAPAAEQPLCLLDADAGGWLQTFLAPLLRGAGYRVATSLRAGEVPGIVVALDAAGATAMPADVPILRLSSDAAAPDGVYRYDRERVLAAVGSAMRRTGSR
ncbi:chemotaxis protein CheA [Sphingomonas baiyangensis]|uniref:Chemotaxis protein CheA n=1 Tax=Sphingomonas baiyangensis TaxID=2572576 RepID=A0A4U1L2Q8_9SPHN|nr:chemotaxis protein CheW [Sphingomonas baiyangensis]TKD50902.1 chemotaxis protein CheA [Sphingomonas baiyangensis]